jgi:serine/threonine protein kinase
LANLKSSNASGRAGWRCVQGAAASLRRTVALKTLQAALAADAEYIARFQNEAVAAASLNHPNLVQVYSAGESDGLHWFAMEYVEGESAQGRLKRKGRIEPVEAIAIAMHVATALDYGWRKAQLIHRDIKPDNIFLSGDGEVKLGDLGLAKSAGQTQGLTMTGASMGTPHYISPEQTEGKKDVDLRTDIYSLGCTLYHMLCGQPPYKGDSAVAVMMKHVSAPVPDLRSVWPECPAELASAVMKMMQKQPAARQQSIRGSHCRSASRLRIVRGQNRNRDGGCHAAALRLGRG